MAQIIHISSDKISWRNLYVTAINPQDANGKVTVTRFCNRAMKFNDRIALNQTISDTINLLKQLHLRKDSKINILSE